MRCRAKDGAADDVLALLPECIEAIRAEPGNVAPLLGSYVAEFYEVADDK